jgi:hypothetical protein
VQRTRSDLRFIKLFQVHVILTQKVPHGTHDRATQSKHWFRHDDAPEESHTAARHPLYSVLKSRLLCMEVRKMPEKKL